MQVKTLPYTKIVEFLSLNESEAKNLYINKGFTARQLATHFHILYNNNFQKACLRVLGEKDMGLGGSRVGAGKTKENKELRKKAFNIITIAVSDETMKILKSQESTYTIYIERAVQYYHKVANRLIEEN